MSVPCRKPRGWTCSLSSVSTALRAASRTYAAPVSDVAESASGSVRSFLSGRGIALPEALGHQGSTVFAARISYFEGRELQPRASTHGEGQYVYSEIEIRITRVLERRGTTSGFKLFGQLVELFESESDRVSPLADHLQRQSLTSSIIGLIRD